MEEFTEAEREFVALLLVQEKSRYFDKWQYAIAVLRQAAAIADLMEKGRIEDVFQTHEEDAEAEAQVIERCNSILAKLGVPPEGP